MSTDAAAKQNRTGHRIVGNSEVTLTQFPQKVG
jgi:hypothetical protein